MAEIFGAVASGAGLLSLALQLTECTVTLRSFCQEVEKVPESLESTILDLEILNRMLIRIDGLRLEFGSGDAEALELCVNVCRNSTEKIVEVTRDLEAISTQCRLLGRAYAAIKLRDINKQCDSLERSKSSLILAFQLFSPHMQMKMMEAQEDRRMQRLLAFWSQEIATQIPPNTAASMHQMTLPSPANRPQHENTHPATHPTDSEGRVLGRRSSRAAARGQRAWKQTHTTWRCQIPSWFSNRIWLLSVHHSQGNWQSRLQTFYLRPFMCEARLEILDGNVEVVRRMFDEGQASPADVYENESALQSAIRSKSVEMCELILTVQLPLHDDTVRDAFDSLSLDFSFWSPSATELQIARRLVDAGDIDFELNRNRLPWQHCSVEQAIIHSHVDFLPLLENNTPSTHAMDAQSRFDFLMKHCRFGLFPDVLTSFFPLEGQGHTLVNLRSSEDQFSVLHLIAEKVVREHPVPWSHVHVSYAMGYVPPTLSEKLAGWRRLFQHMVAADADIHSERLCGFYDLNRYRLTPIGTLLTEAYYAFRNPNNPGEVVPGASYLEVLRTWVGWLSAAGVDLCRYGESEALSWSQNYGRLPEEEEYREMGICAVLYGPTPDDYDLVREDKHELCVYRLQRMPGSWIPAQRYLVPDLISWIPTVADKVVDGCWEKRYFVKWLRKKQRLTDAPLFENSMTNMFEKHSSYAQDDTTTSRHLLRSTDFLFPQKLTSRTKRRASEPVGLEYALKHFKEDVRRWGQAYHFHPDVESAKWRERLADLHNNRCKRGKLSMDYYEDGLSGMVSDVLRGVDGPNETPWTGEVMLSALRACKQFSTTYGFWPANCEDDSFFPRTLDAMEVVGRDPTFCGEFPCCEHQRTLIEWKEGRLDSHQRFRAWHSRRRRR